MSTRIIYGRDNASYIYNGILFFFIQNIYHYLHKVQLNLYNERSNNQLDSTENAIGRSEAP